MLNECCWCCVLQLSFRSKDKDKDKHERKKHKHELEELDEGDEPMSDADVDAYLEQLLVSD